MTELVLGINASGARRGAREFNRSADSIQRHARTTTRSVGRMDGAFSRVTSAVFSLKGALAGLGLGLLGREIIQATTRMQRIESTMRAATGSAQEAGDAMGFVREEAERLGLDLASSAEQFAQLRAAAKGTALQGDETRQIFTAIAEASTAMGLKADQTAGTLNAIQQMISKGNVQAEELRGQLGERLPGAFQIAARSMDMTTQELNKMLENGDVLAADLLPKLAVELQNTFSDQADRASDNLQQNINRLNTAVFDMMAQDGMPALNNAIKDITDLINDDDFQRNFDNFVAGIARVAELGASTAAGIGSLFPKDFEFTNQKIAELRQELERLRKERSRLISDDDPANDDLIDRRLEEVRRSLRSFGADPFKDLRASANEDIASMSEAFGNFSADVDENSKDIAEDLRFTADQAKQTQNVFDRLFSNPRDANAGISDKLRDRNITSADDVLFGKDSTETEAMRNASRMMDRLDRQMEDMQQGSRDLGRTFQSAFEDAVVEGENLRSVLKGLLDDIVRITVRKNVSEPLGDAVAGIDWGALFTSSSSSLGAGTGSSPAMASSADGNLFTSPSATTIAERGQPEAVLPLERKGGKLGVRSSGGGGPSMNIESVDMRGASVEAVQRLERFVKAMNGSIERRAVSAVGSQRQRSFRG